LVSVTKYRHPVHLAAPGAHGADHAAGARGLRAELAEFNGEAEQVHLLVNFPPTMTISGLVNSLKGVSSRRLRAEFPDLRRHYWQANRLRSGSYFAGSVGGAPISVLRQYTEQQNRPS
jgi:putative transposase